MSPERWQRIKAVYGEALMLEGAEREAFLAEACRTDGDLRAEVDTLLREKEGPDLESPIQTTGWIGRDFGHFRLIEKIGEGGMGVVYKAQDNKLDRPVALKFLPPHLLRNQAVRERFTREAKAAAAIDHPNVCTVYEVDEHEGRTFIAMAFLDGRTLGDRIEQGPLPLHEALSVATQIAEGLEAAHNKGIVHRDVKPDNIMLLEGSRGLVKIMDFGLAQLGGASELTQEGTTLGTLYYMSPEQREGGKVDHRSDIWALGVVLYQMLTGERPIRGAFDQAAIYSLLNEAPAEANIPKRLAGVIQKCLENDRKDRYADASELLSDLRQAQSDAAATSRVATAAPARLWRAVAAALLLAATGWWGYQRYQDHRIETQTLPRIAELADQQKYDDAFALLREARERLGDDERLLPLFDRAGVPVSIQTDPPGADVYVKAYDDLDGEWEYVGQSPIEHYFVPKGRVARWRSSRWRIEKPGFKALESIDPVYPSDSNILGFPLAEAASVVNDCLIPASVDGRVGPFSIGCFEVTNAEFKGFVDAGGYAKPEYWEQAFLRNREELSFEQAMELFRDATGRPGPSTWRLGAYAEGEDNYPVTGVSWYEAAAFARFSGKALPTVEHWQRAAVVDFADALTPQSNFGGEGLAAVGSFPAVHAWGVQDMAGNAKEWVWNAVGEDRRLMGGSWNEPTYRFLEADAQSPFDRSPSNGFRLAVYDPDPKLLEPIQVLPFRDYSKVHPADDRTFAIYKGLLDYSPGSLDAETLEADDSSPYWLKLKVEFNAAYGNERIPAYLFLPKNAETPYQTVLFFPGAGAFQSSSSQHLRDVGVLPPIVRSGRAVLYPIYKGSFERRSTNDQGPRRDRLVMAMRDVRRSLDYLGSRDDIDPNRLSYGGYSFGAMLAPLSLALDDRFKAAILFNAGLPDRAFPSDELDPLHYWPRVKLPALLLNGTRDNTFPTEASQKPLFRLLGTPEAHKRQVFYERGHAHATLSDEEIAETLAFLDKYLGPVRQQ
jgi:dienelactone hydrolase